MNCAVYKWRREYGVVWIVDLASEDNPRAPQGAASVTNDAERVIADLVELGVVPDAQPILYRDSRGCWDRLRTRNGRFDDFGPIGAASLYQAVRALRGLSFTRWRDDGTRS